MSTVDHWRRVWWQPGNGARRLPPGDAAARLSAALSACCESCLCRTRIRASGQPFSRSPTACQSVLPYIVVVACRRIEQVTGTRQCHPCDAWCTGGSLMVEARRSPSTNRSEQPHQQHQRRRVPAGREGLWTRPAALVEPAAEEQGSTDKAVLLYHVIVEADIRRSAFNKDVIATILGSADRPLGQTGTRPPGLPLPVGIARAPGPPGLPSLSRHHRPGLQLLPLVCRCRRPSSHKTLDLKPRMSTLLAR
ncbi:hypothetical protein BC831DRAFT_218033 [Entophlyctis helioformis]|nr:hypothetical protein BC831DRAFT_218033 [Entophlyctis helioformis]